MLHLFQVDEHVVVHDKLEEEKTASIEVEVLLEMGQDETLQVVAEHGFVALVVRYAVGQYEVDPLNENLVLLSEGLFHTFEVVLKNFEQRGEHPQVPEHRLVEFVHSMLSLHHEVGLDQFHFAFAVVAVKLILEDRLNLWLVFIRKIRVGVI